MFKETIKKFLQGLRKQKTGLYDNIKDDLSQPYLEKNFDITEKDKEEAQRKISAMAKDMYKLIVTFENHKQVRRYETFKLLLKIFGQQCELKKEVKGSPEIIIKDKPDAGATCSPHTPEARYIRKRKQRVTGFKGFVTETCSEENETQFITDINVEKAGASDSGQLPEIEERLEKNGLKPEKMFGDAGFTNGESIISSKEKGIKLEGPTSGRSQSFEVYNSETRPYDAGDYDISFDEEKEEIHVNKCPCGQVAKSQKRSEKTGKLNVHFDAAVCRDCDDSERCSVNIGVNVSTFKIDEKGFVGATRHHLYMSDPEYRKECGTRAGVEGTVSEMTRAHGMRKSRHRGKNDTMLQMIFAAIACNVKRFIRHVSEGCEYRPLAYQMSC